MCERRPGRRLGVMTTTHYGGDDLAIHIRGLTRRYGERIAVDRLDLDVPRGSAFGLLGPNGAGKTTVVRLLLGLTRATAGAMHVLGHELPARRARALARVGAVVEEPRFLPFLTGRENLTVVAAAREPAARGRIGAALARVGLADRADERVAQYSLGMRQRLGIARCLLADPLLLILDEPTNGLDPAAMGELRRLVGELTGEGRTVLLSSHHLAEVEQICDRAAIIDRGRVLAAGAIADLTAGARSLEERFLALTDPARATA